MNSDRRKGAIRSCAMTQGTVATSMGLSLSRLNAKINETDGAEFSLGEVQALRKLLGLNLNQVEEIFFS